MISPAEFVRAHTAVASPPLCPELRLCLATHITPLWEDLEAWLDRTNVAPPYWAFVWPGGQALSRYVLDNPSIVCGRSVLDLAAGCGASAIAAAQAGGRAEASEIDAVAAAAIGLNAALNGIAVDVLFADVTERADSEWDIIIAGDVCYEKSMTEKIFPWLRAQAAEGATVLLADPGRDYLPTSGLREVARYDVPTSLDLERGERRETSVYRVV